MLSMNNHERRASKKEDPKKKPADITLGMVSRKNCIFLYQPLKGVVFLVGAILG
jgi:hypothetical protein